jgi:hypothetical protein
LEDALSERPHPGKAPLVDAKPTYSRKFTLTVVQAVDAGELRPAQACREYQIAERVQTRWLHEIRLRGAEAAFTPLVAHGVDRELGIKYADGEHCLGEGDAIDAVVTGLYSGSRAGSG